MANERTMRGAGDDDSWMRASASGSRNAPRTNTRYLMRTVVGYAHEPNGMPVEVLECGHRQPTPRSIMGQDKTRPRRRCHSCPNPAAICVCTRGARQHWLSEHTGKRSYGLSKTRCNMAHCFCDTPIPQGVESGEQ